MVLCCFYDIAGQSYVKTFRSGLFVSQNNAELSLAGMTLGDFGRIIPPPELINNQWQRRYDLSAVTTLAEVAMAISAKLTGAVVTWNAVTSHFMITSPITGIALSESSLSSGPGRGSPLGSGGAPCSTVIAGDNVSELGSSGSGALNLHGAIPPTYYFLSIRLYCYADSNIKIV